MLIGRHGYDGVGVFRFSLQRSAFRHIIEEGEELIKISLRNRVILVVVTATAIQCQPQPGHAGRLDAVDNGFDSPFFGDDSPFAVQSMIAIEAGRHDLCSGRVRQQITRELFDRELIEWQIIVEGINNPVSPGPLIAAAVDLKAIAISIAGEIQPLLRHPFAVSRGLEQSIDDLLISVRRAVFQEVIDFPRCRWQSGQIE